MYFRWIANQYIALYKPKDLTVDEVIALATALSDKYDNRVPPENQVEEALYDLFKKSNLRQVPLPDAVVYRKPEKTKKNPFQFVEPTFGDNFHTTGATGHSVYSDGTKSPHTVYYADPAAAEQALAAFLVLEGAGNLRKTVRVPTSQAGTICVDLPNGRRFFAGNQGADIWIKELASAEGHAAGSQEPMSWSKWSPKGTFPKTEWFVRKSKKNPGGTIFVWDPVSGESVAVPYTSALKEAEAALGAISKEHRRGPSAGSRDAYAKAVSRYYKEQWNALQAAREAKGNPVRHRSQLTATKRAKQPTFWQKDKREGKRFERAELQSYMAQGLTWAEAEKQRTADYRKAQREEDMAEMYDAVGPMDAYDNPNRSERRLPLRQAHLENAAALEAASTPEADLHEALEARLSAKVAKRRGEANWAGEPETSNEIARYERRRERRAERQAQEVALKAFQNPVWIRPEGSPRAERMEEAYDEAYDNPAHFSPGQDVVLTMPTVYGRRDFRAKVVKLQSPGRYIVSVTHPKGDGDALYSVSDTDIVPALRAPVASAESLSWSWGPVKNPRSPANKPINPVKLTDKAFGDIIDATRKYVGDPSFLASAGMMWADPAKMLIKIELTSSKYTTWKVDDPKYVAALRSIAKKYAPQGLKMTVAVKNPRV